MCVFSSFVLSQAWASNSFFFFFFPVTIEGLMLTGEMLQGIKRTVPFISRGQSQWNFFLLGNRFVSHRHSRMICNQGGYGWCQPRAASCIIFFFFLIHYCFGLLPSIFIHYWSLHLRKTSLNFLNLNFFTSKKKKNYIPFPLQKRFKAVFRNT